MMWRRVWLMAAKEARHIQRDLRTVFLALGIPLVMLLLFGYALTMDIDDISLLVVDHDRSAASRDLQSSFARTGYFTIVERPDDAAAILPAFRANRAKAALIIERGYAHALDRGEVSEAQFIADGTDANVAAIAMGYAAAVGQTRTLSLTFAALDAAGVRVSRELRPPIVIKSRNWFNPALRSQWYLVPGLVAVMVPPWSRMML